MAPRKISRFETARQMKEGGGFRVRRPIGDKIDTCDPFLLLDHFGPVNYGPGEAVGAPDHPHRGFQTVTYLIDGENTHQDSGTGTTSTLKAGDVQWMIAGSGVVHSEMPSESILKNGGLVEGFQLWVNLPAKDKMTKPRYQDLVANSIPTVKSADGKSVVKVISGEVEGIKADVATHISVMCLDVQIQPGGTYTVNVPAGFNTFAYVWRGSGFLGTEKNAGKIGDVAVLSDDGEDFLLTAGSNDVMHTLVIGGVPIREPVARYGPFVMNTQEEIEQAFADYRAGKLGKIEGSEERYAKTKAAVAQQKKNNMY